MKPIGWTKRRVQLECAHCHARLKVEWLPYISALESEIALPCPECGTEEFVQDRRQRESLVPVERRAVALGRHPPTMLAR
jgi:hypothetical protein